MEPSTGLGGVKTYSFEDSVFHPPGSFGLISLEKTYRKLYSQEGGTDVKVWLEVLGISLIDSLEKLVGLKIFIQLEWEDNRIGWGLEGFKGPRIGEEWEFDSKVLR